MNAALYSILEDVYDRWSLYRRLMWLAGVWAAGWLAIWLNVVEFVPLPGVLSLTWFWTITGAPAVVLGTLVGFELAAYREREAKAV